MSRLLPQSNFGYAPEFTSADVASLRDVNLTGLADGNTFVWNATAGIWVAAVPGTATALNDFNDVVLTAPALNEVLAYDGSDWVNVDTVTLDTVTVTGTVTGGTVTDGTASMTGGGTLTGITALTTAGTVTGTTLTDGTGSMTGATLTGLTSLTAGSITDNVVTMSSGDVSNVSSVTAARVNIDKSSVTQNTSPTTPVTINAAAGTIVTVSQVLGSFGRLQFTVNNNAVSTSSVLIVSIQDYPGVGAPVVYADNITNGSFNIVLYNPSLGGVALNDVLTINFIIH